MIGFLEVAKMKLKQSVKKIRPVLSLWNRCADMLRKIKSLLLRARYSMYRSLSCFFFCSYKQTPGSMLEDMFLPIRAIDRYSHLLPLATALCSLVYERRGDNELSLIYRARFDELLQSQRQSEQCRRRKQSDESLEQESAQKYCVIEKDSKDVIEGHMYAANLIISDAPFAVCKMARHRKPSGKNPVDRKEPDDVFAASAANTEKLSEADKNALKLLFGKYLQYDFAKDTETHMFGADIFYQSYTELHIPGHRNTDSRIAEYGLLEYLSPKKDVFDVGCNLGFFDLTIAPMVNSVTGLEYTNYYLDYGRKAAEFLGISNAAFINYDFKHFKTTKTYDVVFSFAVHIPIGLSLREHILKLYHLLRSGGILLFESHHLENVDDYGIDDSLGSAICGLFCIIREGVYLCDRTRTRTRKYWYLQKID